MTRPKRAGVLGALLRDLATDRRVVDEMVEAARVHSPEVARLPMAENRRHVAALLAAGLASFERLAEPNERDFAEARRLGADRAAQGVSVAGLLRGVQAGRQRVVEIALDRGRAAGIPDAALLEALLELGRYASALECALVDGHHTAELELARTRRDARNRLLRRLLLDEAGEGRPDDLAGFGLRPDGRYHCVVTGLTEPARISAVERQFCGGGAVFGTVDDRLAGLSARLPPAGLATAAGLVVAAPARPLTQAPTLYRLCVAALRAASRAGLRGLHQVVDLAGETALAAQPALAELVSGELLGALDPADEFHRQLVSTALTYLDHGQRLDRTAEALHLHPNTVRYRLRRLQELTGMPPTLAEPGGRWPVPQTLRWWWALRTWLDEG
ncbi:PucR family transcriptional regulator [Micromonospora sp. KC207]|uniref:PucR family transcriptional regulator n=1 Tax=Micromonospora sp. KC207 TaxID=2530377 RepID=UPI0010480F8E|nr:helix-turn-helix domain-containing protein [Micromonospora sp. KC207]TDC51684.1 PucR family transcriptional regulator [Micromonospora sp. KC207]